MSAPLTEGPERAALVRLGAPMALGIVFIIAINVVDTYFVGQLGTNELAAMSFTFPVVTLVMSVAMGLGIGTTSAVSRAIGADDSAAARRLTTHALFLAILVVAVVSGIGVLTQRQLFLWLGAEEKVLPLLTEYMTIWYAGAVFLVVPIVGSGVMRAQGDEKTPMLIMMVSAISNLALDPLMIFGAGPIPRMELRGAALATVLARSVTLLMSLWVLGKRMKLIELHLPSPAELKTSFQEILSVGLPATLAGALTPIATAVMTGLVAEHGGAAVAAYGIGARLEGLLLIPPMAVASALTPFIGQNWGAHRPERVARALRTSRSFVLLWGLAAWLLLLLLGRTLAGLFSQSPQVIEVAGAYLAIVPLSYGAHGLVGIVSSAFNAVDRAVRATLLSAIRGLGLAIPLAWLGARFAQSEGVFAGIAASTVITALLCTWWSKDLFTVQPQLGARRPPPKSGEALVRLDAQMERSLDKLLDRTVDIEGVVVAARPINTLGFYSQGVELGHAHRTGHIDLHVPPPVHDALIAEGRAEHHRLHHDLSWITHRLNHERDVEEAVWLLQLCATIARFARSEDAQAAQLRAALDALDASDSLKDAVASALAHC